MIESFADRTTADIFRERNTKDARRIPKKLWRLVQRKLKMLDASRFDGRMAMPSKSRSKTITRDPRWLGPTIAPGEILLEEFLKPMGLGQVEASRRLEISLNRLNEIVLGKRSITADTALRLARFFKTSPQFWMRLQVDWDLHRALAREAKAS
jgi:addiction module HigA family antidote